MVGFRLWDRKSWAFSLHALPACSEMQDMAPGLEGYGVLQGPNRPSLAERLLTVAQRDILLTDRREASVTQLQMEGFRLSPNKCQLFQEQTEAFGRIMQGSKSAWMILEAYVSSACSMGCFEG